MTHDEWNREHLESVIRSSPADLVGGYYYIRRGRVWPLVRVFARVDDGFESTIISRWKVKPRRVGKDVKGPFRLIRLQIAKPFDAPGFLAAACQALADNNLPVLALSTYSFDYLLVRDGEEALGLRVLAERGFGRRVPDDEEPTP
jgi:hypothetical protein